MSDWGQGRRAVLALLPEIKSRHAQGETLSKIYRELKANGQLSINLQNFCRQFKKLSSAPSGAKWVGLPERRPVHSGVVQTRDPSSSSRSYSTQGQPGTPAAPAMASIQTNDDFTARAFRSKRDFALNALSRGVEALASTIDSTGDK